MPEFSIEIAIIGFLMFSCGSLDRSCWAELKYDRILAVGGRGIWAMTSQSFLLWPRLEFLVYSDAQTISCGLALFHLGPRPTHTVNELRGALDPLGNQLDERRTSPVMMVYWATTYLLTGKPQISSSWTRKLPNAWEFGDFVQSMSLLHMLPQRFSALFT